MKKYISLLLLPIFACSCTESVEQKAIAGGLIGTAVGSQVSDSNQTRNAVIGGVAGYGATKWFSNRKVKKQEQLLKKVYDTGRYQVVKDRFFKANYNNNPGSTQFTEVEVPIDGYTTKDGVVLDPHYKVINIAD